jgi:hypothetical protein
MVFPFVFEIKTKPENIITINMTIQEITVLYFMASIGDLMVAN